MHYTSIQSKSILTRTLGYLEKICSHSLNPFIGCLYGNRLCGQYCYVQHNSFITKRRTWGSFLEIKSNAAKLYEETWQREKNWAHRQNKVFSLFFSSSTDPFQPNLQATKITYELLEKLIQNPPEKIILQTHSHQIIEALPLLIDLNVKTNLKIHVSIESDYCDTFEKYKAASLLKDRIESMEVMTKNGLFTVACLSPIFPIKSPKNFFTKLSKSTRAIILDHFIKGDGTSDGRRTLKTKIPEWMKSIDPKSIQLSYLNLVLKQAKMYYKGKIGIHQDGFSGKYL